jgi:hypothetical protein
MRLHQSSAAHVVVLTASLNPFAKQAVGIGDGALAGACTSISDLSRRGLDAARADREPVPRQANTVLKKAAGWLVQHQRNRKAMKAKNPRGVPTRYTFRVKPAAEVLLPISEKRQSSQKYQSIRQANTLAAQE